MSSMENTTGAFSKGGRAVQIAMAREIDRVMVVGRPDQILLKVEARGGNGITH